jgi:uncharacterized protein
MPLYRDGAPKNHTRTDLTGRPRAYTVSVMANIDRHAPGAFCWMELATTDQAAAKKFYTSLFGWSVEDYPMGPEDKYSMFRLKGRDAAAGYTMRKDQRAQGIPSHWMLYIATSNADASAMKAAQQGGTVLQPAFDVMDAGRMAVLRDPTGAVFSVWQANRNQGIGVANEDNSFCWADLNTPDQDRAAKFYSSVFGWKLERGKQDYSSGYLHIQNGEDFIGGVPPSAYLDSRAPAHWLLYFMVAEVAAAETKAASLGGRILMPARHMEGVGTWAIISDPQGAVLSVFKSDR